MQKYIENIGVRFFNFVEQYYRVGSAANCFGKLTALFVADVSRRRSDKAAYAEFLHVFRHIYTHHVFLIVEKRLSQRFCKLGLADAGRTEEEERADGLVRVGNARARTPYSFGDFLYGFVLTNYALMQRVAKSKQLFALALHQLRYWYARPARDYARYLLVGNAVAQQGVFARALFRFALFFFKLFFQRGQLAVSQLGEFVQVVIALSLIYLGVAGFYIFSQLLHAGYAVLFVLPFCLHAVELIAQL